MFITLRIVEKVERVQKKIEKNVWNFTRLKKKNHEKKFKLVILVEKVLHIGKRIRYQNWINDIVSVSFPSSILDTMTKVCFRIIFYIYTKICFHINEKPLMFFNSKYYFQFQFLYLISTLKFALKRMRSHDFLILISVLNFMSYIWYPH